MEADDAEDKIDPSLWWYWFWWECLMILCPATHYPAVVVVVVVVVVAVVVDADAMIKKRLYSLSSLAIMQKLPLIY
ncbi:hypothetical protein ElyMa_003096200 [Elysia marginata]|uniref:Uncharacterized protein n=1 Tax=Elysia marginata TaxID=1093978 RepID=A0AAV4IPJ5_9GAST|nr:hypothetical protein ElyMa_003096200 [Elysia marginata]